MPGPWRHGSIKVSVARIRFEFRIEFQCSIPSLYCIFSLRFCREDYAASCTPDLIHPLLCQGFLKQYVTEKKQYPECGSTDEQAGPCPVPADSCRNSLQTAMYSDVQVQRFATLH